jgi:hypothetical protein
MEQRFMQAVRGKEEELKELMRENEGYQLKIDALKREVAGTQAKLKERLEWQLVGLLCVLCRHLFFSHVVPFFYRESAIGDVNASHNRNVEILRKKERDIEAAISLAKSEVDQMKVYSISLTTPSPRLSPNMILCFYLSGGASDHQERASGIQ